jgi:hypothetical protein
MLFAHQQQFSTMCGLGLLVTVRVARMFCHIGSQAATTEISSYMMSHSCGKLYHWLSEHECGTCMMVIRHISTALCEVFSVRSIVTGEESLRGLRVLLATLESSGSLPVETLVYAAPVNNSPSHCGWIPVKLSATTPSYMSGSGCP